MLAFAAKDHSFIGNLEQCNGCGGCRKDAPTMCPTFLATGEEYMSTRGRANAIRAALDLRATGEDPLRAQELEDALSNCLSCKACTTECPSNVNLALLKAELIHARYARDGLPLRVRMLSDVDSLGRIGCVFPSLANAALDFPTLRAVMEKMLGISANRSLPHYATERFDTWFVRRKNGTLKTRGKIFLWDDTFVRGMAGAFGMLKAKYDLSLKVAAPLVEKVMQQPPDAVVVASGTSCRHQIDDLTPIHPKRMAELLADAIATLPREESYYIRNYMVIELKLRRVGNSVGVVLPKEALARLNAGEGDALVLTDAPDGSFRVSANKADFVRQMEAAEKVIDRYRNTLRELAK